MKWIYIEQKLTLWARLTNTNAAHIHRENTQATKQCPCPSFDRHTRNRVGLELNAARCIREKYSNAIGSFALYNCSERTLTRQQRRRRRDDVNERGKGNHTPHNTHWFQCIDRVEQEKKKKHTEREKWTTTIKEIEECWIKCDTNVKHRCNVAFEALATLRKHSHTLMRTRIHSHIHIIGIEYQHIWNSFSIHWNTKQNNNERIFHWQPA